MQSNVNKYIMLKENGFDSLSIYVETVKDGLSSIESIKLIRDLFALSLPEAKEIMLKATGIAHSLNDHQSNIFSSLKDELEIDESIE